MAIKKEIWVDAIQGNLFKNNEFLTEQHCTREDQFVLAGALVHIPQAGAKPAVVKNRTVLPATIVKRTDTDIVYLLDEYTTDPTLITNAEQIEESPEKLMSVLSEHIETLQEVIADNTIYNWLAAFAASGAGSPASAVAAASVLRTTGTAVLAHLSGATGNRKLFLEKDLQAAKFQMNKQNVSKRDRTALIPSDMLQQLYDDLKSKYDFAFARDVINGSIPELHGFKIIERTSTAVYDNSGTPVVKAVDAASAATDNDTVVCFQKNSVALALGSVDVFENEQDPEYYGDIYSALARSGGRKRRKNAEGVIAIVQDASA